MKTSQSNEGWSSVLLQRRAPSAQTRADQKQNSAPTGKGGEFYRQRLNMADLAVVALGGQTLVGSKRGYPSAASAPPPAAPPLPRPPPPRSRALPRLVVEQVGEAEAAAYHALLRAEARLAAELSSRRGALEEDLGIGPAGAEPLLAGPPRLHTIRLFVASSVEPQSPRDPLAPVQWSIRIWAAESPSAAGAEPEAVELGRYFSSVRVDVQPSVGGVTGPRLSEEW